MLQTSVDALKLAYRVALDELGMSLLEGLVGDSLEPSTYSIDGEPFEVRRLTMGEPRFVLVNATKSVLVGQHLSGFPVQVEFRALHLRTQALAVVVEEGERIARHFAASEIAESRVWRVALCADATGLVFCREDEENCVTRARKRARFQAPDKVYTRRRSAQPWATPILGWSSASMAACRRNRWHSRSRWRVEARSEPVPTQPVPDGRTSRPCL